MSRCTLYTKAEVYIRKDEVDHIVWGPTHDEKYLVRMKQPMGFSCFVPMRALAEWLYAPVCHWCQGRSYYWADLGDGEVEKEPCEVCHVIEEAK